MISVLIIDSDIEFSRLLSIYMQSEGGFVLTAAENGQAGCDLLADQGFDVILLESELPGVSGFEILRSIRRSGDDTPVIVFTARGDNLERYHAIQDQADGYLPKSCRLPELTRRIRHLHIGCNETTHVSPETGGVYAANLALDSTRQCAYYADKAIPLTLDEYQVLAVLANRSGEIVTRAAITEAVVYDTNTQHQLLIQDCIGNLRKKLGPSADGQQLIRAVDDGYALKL